MRGGRVELQDIRAPAVDVAATADASDALRAFQVALQMEKDVFDALLALHKVADEDNDPQFADFIEGEFLGEQVKAQQELAEYIAQLVRIGPKDGGGLLQWEHEFLG